MSRVEALFDHPKRTLGVLAAVLVAVGIAVGSGAAFTAQTANPANTFTAGALSMSNSKDAAAILSANAMAPGDTVNGTVDIENTGTVAGDFVLSRSALTDTPASPAMSEQLNVVVNDLGDPDAPGAGVEVYNGTLAAMTTNIDLGEWAPGDAHRYEFVVTFDAGADDTYEGAESTATFQWGATSS